MHEGHTARIQHQFINLRLVVKKIVEMAFDTGGVGDL